MGFVPKAKLSALGSRSRGGRGDGLRQGCAERLKDVEEIKIGEIRIPFGGTAAVQGLALPGQRERGRARQTAVGKPVSDEQGLAVPRDGLGNAALAHPGSAAFASVGEFEAVGPFPVDHAVGDHGDMAQAVPVQDALDGVVHAVAHDAEGDAFRAAVPHEFHEPSGDGDRVQKGVQPLQRSLDERDLPLHALAGRDGTPHPFVLDGFPGWPGEPFEDRVGHVERRDGAVEIADDGIRPRREIGQLEHVLLLREGVIGMHVETPGCFPKISKQRATAPEIRGMPLLPL